MADEKQKEKEELTGVQAEIKRIEDEIAKTKYNKHTQGHIGKLKAKLANLREKQQSQSGGAHGYGYGLKKSGDATILMVGFPSVGKSTLLNAVTNANSKVAAYDFTTIDVIPGVLEYNGAHIQVLDLPGLIEGASSGAGRGKEVIAVARNADLVLLIAKAPAAEKELEIMRKELGNANFRLDLFPPEIKITKKSFGGISVDSTKALKNINKSVIKSVLEEFRILNADVLMREDPDIDRFIDSLKTNRVYVPSLVVVTKCDSVDAKRLEEIRKNLKDAVLISAPQKIGLDSFREKVWEKLGLMRVYLKKVGKAPDMEEPMIMKRGSTVNYAAGKIFRAWGGNLKYARVWGPSAKFEGQSLGGEHKLKDGDVVEMHV